MCIWIPVALLYSSLAVEPRQRRVGARLIRAGVTVPDTQHSHRGHAAAISLRHAVGWTQRRAAHLVDLSQPSLRYLSAGRYENTINLIHYHVSRSSGWLMLKRNTWCIRLDMDGGREGSRVTTLLQTTSCHSVFESDTSSDPFTLWMNTCVCVCVSKKKKKKNTSHRPVKSSE